MLFTWKVFSLFIIDKKIVAMDNDAGDPCLCVSLLMGVILVGEAVKRLIYECRFMDKERKGLCARIRRCG